jgi:AcrR family transcriptional regulator
MAVLREQRKDETRRRLYEAAIEIFRRDGVATCRIDDIAIAAGVSRGSFYFHYPTKEHVLIEYMRETEIQITAAIDALPADQPLPEVLDTVSTVLATIWQPDPRLLPDVAAVGMRFTATALTDSESGSLRQTLAERFAAAAQRQELSTLLPAEILSDLYLGNMLAGLLAWYGHQETPLKVVLQSTIILFFGGVAVGMNKPAVSTPPAPKPRARRR